MKLDKYWSGLYIVKLTEKKKEYTLRTFMNENKAHRFANRILKKYDYKIQLDVHYLILPKHKRSKGYVKGAEYNE